MQGSQVSSLDSLFLLIVICCLVALFGLFCLALLIVCMFCMLLKALLEGFLTRFVHHALAVLSHRYSLTDLLIPFETLSQQK